jgi:predicted RNA-binding Zn-ribbon protein involved in translation (DUF1610 family)
MKCQVNLIPKRSSEPLTKFVCMVYGNDEIISSNTCTKICEEIDFVDCGLSFKFESSSRVYLKITLTL